MAQKKNKPRERKRALRSDSSEHAVQATQNASAGRLQPPEHVELPEYAFPYWDAIIENRARDQWNTCDLAFAAQLARAQWRMSKLADEIDGEPSAEVGPRGLRKNPKIAIMETEMALAIRLARMLHVHPEGTVGRAKNNRNKFLEEKKARSSLRAVDEDDDLIPRALN